MTSTREDGMDDVSASDGWLLLCDIVKCKECLPGATTLMMRFGNLWLLSALSTSPVTRTAFIESASVAERTFEVSV